MMNKERNKSRDNISINRFKETKPDSDIQKSSEMVKITKVLKHIVNQLKKLEK